MLAAAVFVLRDREGSTARPRIESLAVLPLANLSSDPEQEYFSDGMTDALITELASIGSLRIISRQSIMRYKSNDAAMPTIGQELNVEGIIEQGIGLDVVPVGERDRRALVRDRRVGVGLRAVARPRPTRSRRR